MPGPDDLYMRLDALRNVVADMTNSTNSLKSTLADLATDAGTTLDEQHWSGPAQEAFFVAKANWDNAASNLAVLLGQASGLLDQIVAMAKTVNDGVVDMWRQYAGS
ncbi:MAG: hypothetical protein V7637_699 [Mycobacteriales bacterium]|jgi:WXG100 family type VII secretion target